MIVQTKEMYYAACTFNCNPAKNHILQDIPSKATGYSKNNFFVGYRPFHKTLPRPSAFVSWISVDFMKLAVADINTRFFCYETYILRPPDLW